MVRPRLAQRRRLRHADVGLLTISEAIHCTRSGARRDAAGRSRTIAALREDYPWPACCSPGCARTSASFASISSELSMPSVARSVLDQILCPPEGAFPHALAPIFRRVDSVGIQVLIVACNRRLRQEVKRATLGNRALSPIVRPARSAGPSRVDLLPSTRHISTATSMDRPPRIGRDHIARCDALADIGIVQWPRLLMGAGRDV